MMRMKSDGGRASAGSQAHGKGGTTGLAGIPGTRTKADEIGIVALGLGLHGTEIKDYV